MHYSRRSHILNNAKAHRLQPDVVPVPDCLKFKLNSMNQAAKQLLKSRLRPHTWTGRTLIRRSGDNIESHVLSQPISEAKGAVLWEVRSEFSGGFEDFCWVLFFSYGLCPRTDGLPNRALWDIVNSDDQEGEIFSLLFISIAPLADSGGLSPTDYDRCFIRLFMPSSVSCDDRVMHWSIRKSQLDR